MKKDMRILVFDNYDSFTYNLVHMIKKLGYNNVEVHRNDKIALADIAHFDKILLSPGPGVPSESGILLELIKTYSPTRSIMGVCLGLQAIGEAFGGKLINLPTVFHGVALQASIIENDLLFKDVPTSIQVGRYHSWAVANDGFPDCLRITAVDDEGTIMALAHKEYDVRAVQFHPESVLTPEGEKIMKNWLEN
jgi:anthranilate synthase component II